MAQAAAARMAEAYAEYTFRPQVSQRSLQIAKDLGTSFLARQQMHLERRQKVVSHSYQHVVHQMYESPQYIWLFLVSGECKMAWPPTTVFAYSHTHSVRRVAVLVSLVSVLMQTSL